MNLLLRATAAAVLLLPLAVAPATAQNYRGAVTLNGGGIWFSDFNRGGPGHDLVLNPDGTPFVGGADFKQAAGWLTGVQLEYWPFGGNWGRRIGFRANGNYTEQPFQIDFDNSLAANLYNGIGSNTAIAFGDVNTWLIDGDVLFRILTPSRNRVWAPFINIGAGVAIYAPAGSSTLAIAPANAIFGDGSVSFVTAPNDSATLIVASGGDNNRTKFVNVFGLGADILPGWRLGGIGGIGIRLEVADHIAWNSPADPIIGGDGYSAIHNLRFTAGVMGTFGRMFPEEQVAILPPAPPPPPPPPPAEESITVCVVDPSSHELRNVSAIYVPSTRDTMVVVNGQRQQFDDVYTNRAPLYVSNAEWFRAGRPLTLQVGQMRTEWVTYGGPRAIDASDLAFLGTIQGTPVYAAEDDVAGIRNELADLRRAQNQHDLTEIARASSRLRQELSELEVVYVPLEPGCVFQPMRRAEEVRKVRG